MKTKFLLIILFFVSAIIVFKVSFFSSLKSEDYIFENEVTIFASGKDGIFTPGTPIGKTTASSGTFSNDVKLFVDPNQLSFVTVNLIRQNKENF